MEPTLPRAHAKLLNAYVESGRFADALAEMREWQRLWPMSYDMPWTWSDEAYVYGHFGRQVLAQRALRKLESVSQGRIDLAPINVVIYSALNNNDEALVWLEKAYQERSNIVTTLKVDPIYDPLRNDPHFHELERRVGLTR